MNTNKMLKAPLISTVKGFLKFLDEDMCQHKNSKNLATFEAFEKFAEDVYENAGGGCNDVFAPSAKPSSRTLRRVFNAKLKNEMNAN